MLGLFGAEADPRQPSGQSDPKSSCNKSIKWGPVQPGLPGSTNTIQDKSAQRPHGASITQVLHGANAASALDLTYAVPAQYQRNASAIPAQCQRSTNARLEQNQYNTGTTPIQLHALHVHNQYSTPAQYKYKGNTQT